MICAEKDCCFCGSLFHFRGTTFIKAQEAGFREIRVETIEGMRHEILNETEKETVFRLIRDFLNEV